MKSLQRKKPFWWGLLVLLAIGASEGSAHLVILFSDSFLSDPIRRRAAIYAEQASRLAPLLDGPVAGREVLDRELGWMYRPGLRSATDNLNEAGLRSLQEYVPRVPPGRVRVAAFGDSFVYGNEVPDRSAWPAQIERMDSGVEVLNYGVGGYGLDQAYLRYLRDGEKYHPQVVVIGFVPVSQQRIVNVYRRFVYSNEWPFIKPRFVLDSGGELELLSGHVPDAEGYRVYVEQPSRIRELGHLDYWYEPLIYDNPLYEWSATVRVLSNFWPTLRRRTFDQSPLDEQPEAYRLEVAIMEAFAKAVGARGARPLVVFFPDRRSVMQAVSGEALVYAPLHRVLQAKGIAVLDLAPEFAGEIGQNTADDWFMPGGHYSHTGNHVAARAILRAVQQLALTDQVAQRVADPRAR